MKLKGSLNHSRRMAKPHWMYYVLIMMRTIWYPTGGFYYSVHPDLGKVLPVQLFILWLTLAYAVPLLFWRNKYAHLYALSELLLSGGLIFFIHAYTDLNPLMFMIPTMMAGFLSHSRALKWTAPVFMVIFPALRGYVGNLPLSETVIAVMISVIMFSVGFFMRRIIELLEENRAQLLLIEEKNQLLKEYSEKVEQMTLWEERTRLAQELHDTVGHTFTSVIMGMDAILCTIEHKPDEARQSLEKLAERTRSGLEEMRKTVHRMAAHQEESWIDQLSGICSAFAQHTGVRVSFAADIQPQPLPADLQHIFIRCLQEALTNAIRHGQATQIGVNVAMQEHSVQLSIENNGRPIPHLQFGFGLRTMEHRLQERGGNLIVESGSSEGVKIVCTLPLRPAVLSREE